MRRRDVLRTAAAAAALPMASTAATATTDQASFEPLDSVALSGTKEVVVGDAGETAYAATTDGFATVDVTDPDRLEVLAEVTGLLADRENGPMEQVYDVKVDGDTLIAVGPANPPRSETVQGVAVFDVSDPSNPERTSFYETDYPIHNSYLQGDIAYLTANDGAKNPAVLVDVSGENVLELSRWSNVDYDERWRDVAPYLRTCHDIYVHGDTMYLAYWDAGTWLVDVSDPTSPEYVNHFGHYDVETLQDLDSDEVGSEGLSLPGNSHYVAVNDDASLLASGAEAWDVDPDDGDTGQGGIDLWDVSDPQDPEKLSYVDAPPTPDGTRRGTWTTSHNFEFRGGRLYTSWYQGGVKLYDVSDPSSPEQLAWWRQPDQTSFWTARYATESAFVAGSMMGGEDYPAGVYAFPNRAGEQPNPPTLVEDDPNTTTDGNATTTTGSPATTTTATETATATETTAVETTAAGTTADTTESGGTDGGTPGFGVLAAVSGVSAAALAAWRRLQ